MTSIFYVHHWFRWWVENGTHLVCTMFYLGCEPLYFVSLLFLAGSLFFVGNEKLSFAKRTASKNLTDLFCHAGIPFALGPLVKFCVRNYVGHLPNNATRFFLIRLLVYKQ